jgi:4-diphosphocytidyl-2-C-methyl-D-erythritol kinase
MKVERLCPAKINLFLKIINKRADGFHELKTLMCKIDLFDKLIVEKSDKFDLKIDGEFANYLDKNNNLFFKIFEYFQKNFLIDSDLKISITKNIPVGAGLGGGSSDYASFIKILNELFLLNLSKSAMQNIAAKFGSDMPFFFEKNLVLAEGRGEITRNFPVAEGELDKFFILLINPKIHLATKEIFQLFAKNFSSKINKIDDNNFENLIAENANDLENAAIIKAPIIAEIIKNLQKFSPICAKMSGSGSSCFAIFKDAKLTQDCQKYFLEKYPNFFVKICKFVE